MACGLLKEALEESKAAPQDLVALDVGAGNGIAGEELACLGIDIIEEEVEAAHRDRPGVYDSYYVEDLTQLPASVENEINREKPNGLSIVAALGFDDISSEAFARGYNPISDKDWIAFNINDEFLQKNHSSGFSNLIDRMVEEDVLEIIDQHHLGLDDTPLNYYAVVGKKQGDISDLMLREFQQTSGQTQVNLT